VDRAGEGGDVVPLHLKIYYHRTATNFAVIIDLRRNLCERWQWNVKFLKAGGTDDRGGIHGF
jgi:hypothetical protein